MFKPDFKLRAEKTLSVPLARAHRALNQAARTMARGRSVQEQTDTQHNLVTLGLPQDVVTLEHWSLNYLDFGFTARQNKPNETHIEFSLSVYLTKLPFARTYFEFFIEPKLSEELRRFGLLSEAIADRRNTQTLLVHTRTEALTTIAA